MKKNIITTTLAAAMVATTILTTGISAHAAEAPAAQTQVAQQKLNPTVIAKVFDAKYYAQAYPDVVAVLGSDPAVLLNHYMTSGIYEGRDASASFNYSVYAVSNPDLLAAYGTNIEAFVLHFATFGKNENRTATTAQFAALDKNTQAQVVSASKEAASANNVDINAYRVTPSAAPTSTTNSATKVVNGVTVPDLNAGQSFSQSDFDVAYNYYLNLYSNFPTTDLGNGITVSAESLAKEKAYNEQNIHYNSRTGETQAYGTTVVEGVAENGLRYGTHVDMNGIATGVTIATGREISQAAVDAGAGDTTICINYETGEEMTANEYIESGAEW